MSMTSVCFGIVKVQCQKFNIIGYFFSLSYMPMYDMLIKRKICKENKSKKIKMLYRMYLEGDNLHQVVMIVCELK